MASARLSDAEIQGCADFCETIGHWSVFRLTAGSTCSGDLDSDGSPKVS